MDAVKQYLANIGSKGGRAKGQVKARDSQAMREAQKKSVIVRRANAQNGVSPNVHGADKGKVNS